jgi:hypothetical protein
MGWCKSDANGNWFAPDLLVCISLLQAGGCLRANYQRFGRLVQEMSGDWFSSA